MHNIIYHDTIVFILDKEQSEQMTTEDFGFNSGIFQDTAKVLTARIIGRKIKKIVVLVEISDIENYLYLKARSFEK